MIKVTITKPGKVEMVVRAPLKYWLNVMVDIIQGGSCYIDTMSGSVLLTRRDDEAIPFPAEHWKEV